MLRPGFLHGNQADCDRLSDLAMSVRRDGCSFAEVGTHVGGSAVVLGCIVKGFGKLYCIDNDPRPTILRSTKILPRPI